MVFAGLSRDAIAAASNPRLTIGHGVLAPALEGLRSFCVATQPEPWSLVPSGVRQSVGPLWLVESMEIDALEVSETALPPVHTAVGIGGGAAVDAAKYLAWKRGIPVVTVPTIVSVDAAVTNTIAVREAGRVKYVGFVVPDHVVLDLDLVQCAPPALNRAGVGDLLSIHTGLFDWRLAARAGAATLDERAATRAGILLNDLFERADGVRNVTDAALEWLVRAYIENNALCLDAGTAQPEEGSEHFWAYHVEAITGRSFVHGELVSLGVLLMCTLQENDPERVRAFLEAAGVRFHPRDLGLSREQFAQSLRGLRDYTRAEGHWYTVVETRPPDQAFVQRMAHSLEF